MTASERLVSRPRHPQRLRAEAEALCARIPLLVFEARRIAASVHAGLHGRGRRGPGETFWQFRPLMPGESATRIDWRRSARHDGVWFIRDHEWETQRRFDFFVDQSLSMFFGTDPAPQKIDRALIITLALAECLMRAGERVTLINHDDRYIPSRIIDQFAEALLPHSDDQPALPEHHVLARHSHAMIVSDFLVDGETLETSLATLAADGARGTLLRIVDPAEATFPYVGQSKILGAETDVSHDLGEAADQQSALLKALASHQALIDSTAKRYGFATTNHQTNQSATAFVLDVMLRLTARDSGGAARL